VSRWRLTRRPTDVSVDGKVVAITGVTAGIGRTTAEVFAARGAIVVGCGRREDRGRKVEADIADAGGTCTFVPADVTSPSDCRRFVDAAVDEHGRIDVLINNAGAGGHLTATHEMPDAEYAELLALNLHSTWFCSRQAITHMLDRGDGGVILNIASVQAVLAVARAAPYNIAKAAVVQLTKTLAVEYLEHGIRCNVIIMGGARTAASASAAREVMQVVRGPGSVPDFSALHLPPPLTGVLLEDVAAALAALASDDCRAITGAEIAIDQAQTAGSLYSEAVYHALSGGWSPT
jgi:NAD(P)-dependent dehydrogenase (short-subunit alcohol dehydrogenase family)